MKRRATRRSDGDRCWPSLAARGRRRPGAAAVLRAHHDHRVLPDAPPASTPATRCGSSGVKVGTIDSIEPDGTQAQDDPEGRPRRADPGRRQGRDRRPEPGRRALRPADPGLPARQRTQDGRRRGDPVDRTAIPVEWDEVKTQLDAPGNRSGSAGRRVDHLGGTVHRQRRQCAGRQRRQAASDAGPTVRRGPDPRRRQRQHRRHHQEPADLRHRAAGQQRSDRPVPEPVGDADQRGQRQQVRPRRAR